jgi:hypothetical protein
MMVFGQKFAALPQTFGHDLDNTAGQSGRYPLRETGHPDPRRGFNLAAVRHLLPADHLEEGRLPGPVAPQDTDPFARFDLQRNIFQQRPSAKTVIDLMQCAYCHYQPCTGTFGGRPYRKTDKIKALMDT